MKTDTAIVTRRIHPGIWIGDMADLNTGRRPQFVVFGVDNDVFRQSGQDALELASITQAYGAPAVVYGVGSYQVALLRMHDQ